MQYLVAINQAKAVEWGLNAQQAMLFAFLHQVPTWADARQIDGHTFFNIGKGKICEELPLLTDKHDTAYRLMKQLAKLDLIVMTSCDNRTYMRLTDKGVTWNRSAGSEKNPTSENSPSGVGKISDLGSEKSPTNQGTNDPNPNSHSGAGESIFEQAARRTGDGEMPPTAGARQFAMTLDWQPDPEHLAAACQRAGLPADTQPATHQLAKFTAHHADQPSRRHGAMAWTAKLVDWIRNDQRQQTQQPTPGGAHAQRKQRTPTRRLTAAEARERDRQRQQAGGGNVFDGEWTPGR